MESFSFSAVWCNELGCLLKAVQFDVDIVSLAYNISKNKIPAEYFLVNLANFLSCNFIRNEAPAQVFSCEF